MKQEYLRSLRQRQYEKPTKAHGKSNWICRIDKGRLQTKLYERKDNVIRALKLRLGKTCIERPIQFFYPLELSCNTWKTQKTVHQWGKQPLNVNANEFKPRRNAAAIAEARIRDAA